MCLCEQTVALLIAHGADPKQTLQNDELFQIARAQSYVHQKLEFEREKNRFRPKELKTAKQIAEEAAAAAEQARQEAEEQAARERKEAETKFNNAQIVVEFDAQHASLGFRVKDSPALASDRFLSTVFNARVEVRTQWPYCSRIVKASHSIIWW